MKKFPEQLDQKNESADAVVHPRSVTIHPGLPMNEIMRMIHELFGTKNQVMEDACDHWQQNNTDELKDPSLEIDYAMGIEKGGEE